MAKNVSQVFAANPRTSVGATDLIYLGVGGVDGAVQGSNLYNSSANNAVFNNLTLVATTNQVVLGTTNTTTITSPAPSASRVYTVPDAGANANFLMSQGTQTIAGANTFSSAVTINPASNQLVLGVTNTATINAAAPSASRVYTIPDAGANASFVMTQGAQTIAGATTFSSAVTINTSSNQLVLGSTNTVTASVSGISQAYTCSFPNAGTSNANFVISEGSQTINGLLILSNTLTLSKTTNQIQLSGPTNVITITAPSPSASRTYTIPDSGANSSFVMTDGSQTLNSKTLSSPTLTTPVLGTPSSGTLTNCTGLPEAGVSGSGWTDFSGTIGYTGFSGTPTTTTARYKTIGSITHVSIQMTGTSNSTSFTITGLPLSAVQPITVAVTYALDNSLGSFVAAGSISASSTTISMLKNENATGWTNSGTKAAQFSFFYETT